MSNSRPRHIKVIIFDVGGVVVGSPIAGIHSYERTHGLPHNYLNVAITARGHAGAFQKLERSELDLFSFYEQFGRELSETERLNQWYKSFCASRGQEIPPLPERHDVDGRELFGIMMRQSVQPDERVVRAIERLRETGRFKIAALTNNFSPPITVPDSKSLSGTLKHAPTLDEELSHLGLAKDLSRIRSLFDVYYESSAVGSRKPEPEFYKHALCGLGVHAEETIFLDDIGPNLKAAQRLGMRTIRMRLESSLPALEELERYTSCRLIDDEDRKTERRRLAELSAARNSKL